jgi:hypothetical protein
MNLIAAWLALSSPQQTEWIPGAIVAGAGVAIAGGALAFDIASPTSRNRVVDAGDWVAPVAIPLGVALTTLGGVWIATEISE